VRALASAFASYDGAAELDRALELLFIGFTTTLSPDGRRNPPVPGDPHDATRRM